MNKFTQGPWVAEVHSNERYCISGNNGRSVVAWTEVVSYKNPDYEEANARLIAKAPELYEAVKDLIEMYQDAVYNNHGKDLGIEDAKEFRKLLKEIDGE